MIESLIMAGGSVLGGAISGFGASSAAEEAAEAQKMAIRWERKKYNDWKALYGDIEQNLSDYYTNLTPETYAARSLEAIELEFNQLSADMNEFMVQRGIREDSGIGASLQQGQGLAKATARARARANAPQEVADLKQNFLGLGFQQDKGDVSGVLRQNMMNTANISRDASIAAGEAIGTAIQDSATALSDYFNNRKADTPVLPKKAGGY